MKTSKLIITIFSFITSITGFSQDKTLNNFQLIPNDEKVSLHWILETGTSCNGITIYRSVDSINYDEVGHIAGICGGYSTPQSYLFTDIAPVKKATNYYRLKLGNLGYSQTVAIKVVHIENGKYEVRPNPASISTRIYYRNEKRELHTIALYNMAGIIMHRAQSTENNFEINLTDFPAGQYIFSIIPPQGQAITRGTLLVNR